MARRPDVPCAGCGHMLWGGSTSLPAGARRCRSCRKADRCGTPNGYRKGCRCEQCRGAVNAEQKRYRVARADAGIPIGGGGSWISSDVRSAIYKRDEYTCQLCGRVVDVAVHYMEPNAPTLDHIRPRALGGSDDPLNLRLACRRCNCARGADIEWRPDHANV